MIELADIVTVRLPSTLTVEEEGERLDSIRTVRPFEGLPKKTSAILGSAGENGTEEWLIENRVPFERAIYGTENGEEIEQDFAFGVVTLGVKTSGATPEVMLYAFKVWFYDPKTEDRALPYPDYVLQASWQGDAAVHLMGFVAKATVLEYPPRTPWKEPKRPTHMIPRHEWRKVTDLLPIVRGAALVKIMSEL